MKQFNTFIASLALTCLAFFPAITMADDDDLDVTMEVFDDLKGMDDDLVVMRGPDHEDEGEDHESDRDEESGDEMDRVEEDDDFEHEDEESDDDMNLEEEDDHEEGEEVDDDESDEH